MTDLMQPRPAAGMNSVTRRSAQDAELTTLVRRWLATSRKAQARAHRYSPLRLAPEPRECEPAAPGPVAPAAVGPERVVGERAYVVGATPTRTSRAGDRVHQVSVVQGPQLEPPVCPSRLPQRAAGTAEEHMPRVALLVDARRISAAAAAGLLRRLGERGSVNVCRAYADWNSAHLGDWVGQMRREGMHSFHHFAEDDDQALVAMTIDAVDIARDAGIDELVIAGDLTSALPLVHRLHAAGVRVVAVGSGHTPHDVRAACHEFIDTGTLDGSPVVAVGRHRA